MSKKQAQQVSVELRGDTHHEHTALYKQIALKSDALRFLHLERKGNTWLLLDATAWPEEEWSIRQISYLRADDDEPNPRLVIAGKEVSIRVYTVINLPGLEFYHLDELPDGSWRVTHNDGFLTCDHKSIETLSIRKV